MGLEYDQCIVSPRCDRASRRFLLRQYCLWHCCSIQPCLLFRQLWQQTVARHSTPVASDGGFRLWLSKLRVSSALLLCLGPCCPEPLPSWAPALHPPPARGRHLQPVVPLLPASPVNLLPRVYVCFWVCDGVCNCACAHVCVCLCMRAYVCVFVLICHCDAGPLTATPGLPRRPPPLLPTARLHAQPLALPAQPPARGLRLPAHAPRHAHRLLRPLHVGGKPAAAGSD